MLGTGGMSTEIVPFATLRGLRLRASRPAPAGSMGFTPQTLTVTVTLTFQEASRRPPRRLTLAVAELDRKEEGSDLALRLASVVGFDYQRLVRNDAREIEMEFSGTEGAGFTPLVQTTVPADYARDEVAEGAQAAAAREHTPRFDPASFKGDHTVAVWEPPSEIRFHRPMTFAAIGCAPFVLPLFLGPWVLVSALRASASGIVRADGLVTGGFFAVVGVAIGFVALFIISGSMPRDVVFDGSARRLRFKNLAFESGPRFSGHRVPRAGLRSHPAPEGDTQLLLPPRGERDRAGPGVQGDRRADHELLRRPRQPYAMGLPLLTDLSAATGLPKVVTDFK